MLRHLSIKGQRPKTRDQRLGCKLDNYEVINRICKYDTFYLLKHEVVAIRFLFHAMNHSKSSQQIKENVAVAVLQMGS